MNSDWRKSKSLLLNLACIETKFNSALPTDIADHMLMLAGKHGFVTEYSKDLIKVIVTNQACKRRMLRLLNNNANLGTPSDEQIFICDNKYVKGVVKILGVPSEPGRQIRYAEEF